MNETDREKRRDELIQKYGGVRPPDDADDCPAEIGPRVCMRPVCHCYPGDGRRAREQGYER